MRIFASGRAAAAAVMGLCVASSSAAGQSAEHVAAVKAAMERSPVRAGVCSPVAEDFMGWPKNLVQRCDYKQGEAAGVAYVLDVKPETLAKWIEAGCAANMVGVGACFERILGCAEAKSGVTFVLGGDYIALREGKPQHVFYRNGVAISAPAEAGPGAAEQEKLAHLPESAVETMPAHGGVAFWQTMPFQFAVKAIELGVPAEMNTPERRQQWLEIVRAEVLASLAKNDSRLLSGWMKAHPITLRSGECPGRSDP